MLNVANFPCNFEWGGGGVIMLYLRKIRKKLCTTSIHPTGVKVKPRTR